LNVDVFLPEGKFSLEKYGPFKNVLIMVVLASLPLSGYTPKLRPSPTLTNSVSIPPDGAVNPHSTHIARHYLPVPEPSGCSRLFSQLIWCEIPENNIL